MQSAAVSSTVKFIFPGRGGRTGMVELPWVSGKTIKQYMHDPALRHSGIIGVRERCLMQNRHGKPLRLNYSLEPGELVVLARQRPM